MKRSESATAIGFTLLLAVPLTTLLRGWALSVLWAWFVTPFFGIKLLPIGYALGLAILVGYLVPSTECQKEDDSLKSTTEKIITVLAKAILAPLLAVGMGWIIRYFLIQH